MYNDNQDLSGHELAALAALPRELAPSDLLEERVVSALRSEGHFNSTRKHLRKWIGTSLRIAAGLALFVGGVATGRYMMAPSAPDSVEAAATIRKANSASAVPTGPQAARTVKNKEKLVAEREMWL